MYLGLEMSLGTTCLVPHYIGPLVCAPLHRTKRHLGALATIKMIVADEQDGKIPWPKGKPEMDAWDHTNRPSPCEVSL